MHVDANAEEPSGLQEAWTIGRILNWSATWLREHSVDKDAQNHRFEAELLMAHVLNTSRMKIILDLEKPLSVAERADFKSVLKRRLKGEPVAYILGYRDFYRHRFKVNKNVLIPRPDTEILVEVALKALKTLDNQKSNLNVLDIGTGSGCIALSLASLLPNAQVIGVDRSPDAIELSRINQLELKIENADFVTHDIAEYQSSTKFDLIVSNPPYISWVERDDLSISVKEFEPSMALFDTISSDGLGFYRTIVDRCQFLLNSEGYLVFECGRGQAPGVAEIMTVGGFMNLTITKDLAGIQRVVSGNFLPT